MELNIDVTGTIKIKDGVVIGKLIKVIETTDEIYIVNDFDIKNRGVSRNRRSHEMVFDNDVVYIHRNEAEVVEIKFNKKEHNSIIVSGASVVELEDKHNFDVFKLSGSSVLSGKIRRDSNVEIYDSATFKADMKKRVKNLTICMDGSGKFNLNNKNDFKLVATLFGTSVLTLSKKIIDTDITTLGNSEVIIKDVQQSPSDNVTQIHTGNGDNVGGDKIVYAKTNIGNITNTGTMNF